MLEFTYEFSPLVSLILLYAVNVFNSLGKAAIYANIFPFITDQMIRASSDELRSCSKLVVLELSISFYGTKRFCLCITK